MKNVKKQRKRLAFYIMMIFFCSVLANVLILDDIAERIQSIVILSIAFFVLGLSMFEYFSYDNMTGVFQRKRIYFDLFLKIRFRCNFVLIYLDFNKFKEVNDKIGHHKGDELLCDFANSLKIAKQIKGYRFGGDEFVLVISRNFLENTDYIDLLSKRYDFSYYRVGFPEDSRLKKASIMEITNSLIKLAEREVANLKKGR